MDRRTRIFLQEMADAFHEVAHNHYQEELAGEADSEDTLFVALSQTEQALMHLGGFLILEFYPCLVEPVSNFGERIQQLMLAQEKVTEDEAAEAEEVVDDIVREIFGDGDGDDDERDIHIDLTDL